MKNELKKIAAVFMTIALVMGFSVPTLSAKSIVMEGVIEDMSINMDFPTDGSMIIRPYDYPQIDTGIMYFKNNYPEATEIGEQNVTYKIGIAGYTCREILADPTSKDKIILEDEIDYTDPDETRKIIVSYIQIGRVLDPTDDEKVVLDSNGKPLKGDSPYTEAPGTTPVTTEQALVFSKNFRPYVHADVKVFSKQDYGASVDGVIVKDYTRIPADEFGEVAIPPGMVAPFRISGYVNTYADWQIGDGVSIVPIFSINISTKILK